MIKDICELNNIYLNKTTHMKDFDKHVNEMLKLTEAYKAAPWDDPKKKKIDAGKISCEEDYEIYHLKKIIKKTLPEYTDEEIDNAIETCCKKNGQSREVDDFIGCVVNNLSKL